MAEGRVTQDLSVLEFNQPAVHVTQDLSILEFAEPARVTQVLQIIEFTAPDVIPPVGPVGKSFATIV